MVVHDYLFDRGAEGELRLTVDSKTSNRDLDAVAVSVRLHGEGPPGAKLKGEVVAEILATILGPQA